jgi:hypothetical protein
LIRSIATGALGALLMLTAAPTSASPTDDVRNAMLKFVGLNSYEMSFGSGSRTGTMDFIRPDSTHMTMGGMEMIHLGSTTYMKMGGKWQKYTTTRRESGPTQIADRINKMVREANGVTATDLGMKSVGGEMLHAYKMRPKNGSGGIVYIGGDGLPHRFQGDDSPKDMVTISKFNAVPPIRPPM